MQEEDIPLLTEVHALPTQPIKINADLIAEIVAQMKPQLEDVIKIVIERVQRASVEQVKEVLKQEVSQVTVNARQAVVAELATFVDKTKADLATEVPKMLHANMALIKSDLEREFDQMQTQFQQKIEQTISLRIQAEIEQLLESVRLIFQK
jgi:hypothetical protein